MGRSEALQRLFVTRGRPAAAAVSFVAFGIAALFSDSPTLERFLVVLVLGFLLTQVPAWIALSRGHDVTRVTQLVLLSDIAIVAALTAALDSENLLVVAYLAPISFTALLYGPRFTAVLTALAFAAVVVVGFVFIDAGWITVLADLIVLTVTGGILAGLSREMHAMQGQLDRDRASDEAALHVAEQIGFPQTFDDVFHPSVEELGRATGASRCILRLRPLPDGTGPVYEWDRPGESIAAAARPAPPIQRVFETGEPLVVGDTQTADEETRSWAEEIGARSVIVWPVFWRGEVMAAMGFSDDRTREWETDGLPLLRRVAPLVGAALAQVQAFEELQRVTHLRAELVARVSHELRTPLTSTIGFLRTLERSDVRLNAEQRDYYLQIARAEAERLASLVEDLLELARVERGNLRLKLEDIEVRPVAERAARAVGAPPEREVALEVPHGHVVKADPDRLLQVLSNLVENAIRHGAGKVVVASAPRDGFIEISISDEGAAIPDEEVGELFQPFARGRTPAGGTGLGLAIARALVEAHGGRLEYRRATEDGEHAFVAALPVGE
jgi:signal transduction histidine kinase